MTDPIYMPADDRLVNVVVALAFNIKHISFTNSPPAPKLSSEPQLLVGDNKFVGLVGILDFIEGCNDQHSLFPNGNKGMPIALKYWSEKFLTDGMAKANSIDKIKEHLLLISRQLNDGRNFLQGEVPSLADIFAFSPIYILSQQPDNLLVKALPELPVLEAWCVRMRKINS